MNHPAIISLGEVLWDLFPEGARFGGAPANFACHAAALGSKVTMVSAVGDDARGDEAITILKQYGIDTSLIHILTDAPTGSVGVELDGNGKPTFTIHPESAWDRIVLTSDLDARVRDSNAVYFGTLGQRADLSRNTIRRTLNVAKKLGILRILDINLRPPFFDDAMIRDSIAHAGILKLSDDELPDVCNACAILPEGRPEDSLRQLLTQNDLDLVVMTRGAQGALLVSPDETVDQPGIPTTVRDTVGAGDAFTAALVLGLLRNDPHPLILQEACELAAEVCTQPGAVPGAKVSRGDAETQRVSINS